MVISFVLQALALTAGVIISILTVDKLGAISLAPPMPPIPRAPKAIRIIDSHRGASSGPSTLPVVQARPFVAPRGVPASLPEESLAQAPMVIGMGIGHWLLTESFPARWALAPGWLHQRRRRLLRLTGASPRPPSGWAATCWKPRSSNACARLSAAGPASPHLRYRSIGGRHLAYRARDQLAGRQRTPAVSDRGARSGASMGLSSNTSERRSGRSDRADRSSLHSVAVAASLSAYRMAIISSASRATANPRRCQTWCFR